MTTKSLFYYPVSINDDGAQSSSIAPLVQTLPLESIQDVVILAQDVGAQSQGMYVNDGDFWRFALPYVQVCAAGIFANGIVIYADPSVGDTAPAGSTVYKNGILQPGLTITAGKAIYTVLIPPAGGGGGGAVLSVNGMTGAVILTATNLPGLSQVGKTGQYSDLIGAPAAYSLPAATSAALGGVIVPGASNLSVDGLGNIDIDASLITTINGKIGSFSNAAGTGTSIFGGVAGGVGSLKTLTAGTNITLNDAGGTITINSSGAGAITLTGDVTGSGAGSVVTTLANSGVTAGTFTKITVDAKGRATVGALLNATDVNTALGYTAYNGTANPNGFLTTNQSIAVTGDASGTGSTAITLTLANVVAAGTYKSVTVDVKGRVVAGTNPTTLAGMGITDGLANTGGSITGDLTFSGGFTVKGLPLPAVNGDAASKLYVDNAIAGVATGTNWKTNAEFATTANITLSGTQTVDGYAAVVGNRGLVKNQTNPAENGVYVVAAGAWTRALDVDTGAEVKGMAILVINGTANALTQWVNTNTTAPVLGTDPVTYAMLQGAGSTYTAGTGLTLAGNQFSITNTGVVTGTFTKVTVNAQGQVTTGANLNATDVNTALGYTAYNGATNPSGFLLANQAITVSGDATGTGTTAIALVLANSGVSAGTFTKVTVDVKGRVTVGANLASGDITTALGFTPVNKAGDTLTGALNYAPSVTIAAAATTNIGAAASNFVTISGNTTITAFDTVAGGALREIVFSGTPTLTHNATSLRLPTGADIVVAAGDSAAFLSLGAGNWQCISYQRASGASLVGAPDATKLPLTGGTLTGALNLAGDLIVASAATMPIGAAASNNILVSGTTTITAFDTIAAGASRKLTFTSVLTLTHNATSLILPTGANITTANGDVGHFTSLGAGNWRCDYYTPAGKTPASLAGAETLTNKTLVNATVTNFVESGVAVSTAAHTVDLTNGTDIEITTTGNLTVTLPTAAAGKSYTVTIVYGGAHTVTFAGGTAIKYAGGVAPVATSVAGKIDIYVIKCNRAGNTTFVSDGGRNF